MSSERTMVTVLRTLAMASAVLVASLCVSACAKISEPWMGADAQTKQQWQSPPADPERDQLRNRLMTSQTDR